MRVFLLLLTVLSSSAFALSVCTVQITNEKFNGEKIKITFHTRLHSKKECVELATLHRSNFQGNVVRQKTVVYRWGNTSPSDQELSLKNRRSGSRKTRR